MQARTCLAFPEWMQAAVLFLFPPNTRSTYAALFSINFEFFNPEYFSMLHFLYIVFRFTFKTCNCDEFSDMFVSQFISKKMEDEQENGASRKRLLHASLHFITRVFIKSISFVCFMFNMFYVLLVKLKPGLQFPPSQKRDGQL